MTAAVARVAGVGRGRGAPPGPAVPGPGRLPAPAPALLAEARRGLSRAGFAETAAERYAAAHLAALRAAAAVLAVRARPVPARRRGRPPNAWALLAAVAPELREWSAFFAAGARKRAAAEAQLPGRISPREADDLLRDAERFLELVEQVLGVQHQAVLPGA